MKYKPEITRGNKNQKPERLNGKMWQGDTGTEQQQNRQMDKKRGEDKT